MPLDILLRVRKNNKSLRVSALIAVNYPHGTLKGATIKNLPLVGLSSSSTQIATIKELFDKDEGSLTEN